MTTVNVKTRFPPALIVVIALLGPPLAIADNTPATANNAIPNHPSLRDNFMFSFGGYYPRTTTAARVDANTGAGVVIDFEDALGLEDRKFVFEGAFRWRFAGNWRLDAGYFSLNRRATRVLQDQIEWGDETFSAGAEVDSRFKVSDLRASIGYSFFRRQDKEFGVGLGLHSSSFLASIETSGGTAEARDVTAPLPVVNFYGMVALTDTWAVSMQLDWLSLSYQDYSGDVRYLAMDLLYQPFRHIGFGVGFHDLLYNLEMDSDDWRGIVRLQFHGPSAFMTVSF